MVGIYNFSLKRDRVAADIGIVLGAAVWGDSPSPVFEERIKHAINLYHNGDVKQLIFTGGVGNKDEPAESEVARTYAIKNGIPEDNIFIETSSKNTFENITESKKIMDNIGVNSVLIISDPLHMKRAITMAKDLEMSAYSSPTPTTRYRSWKTKLGLLSSETYYYIGYLLRKLYL